MRELVKLEKPQVLIDNEAAWTQDLLAVIARGEDPSPTQKGRYRHPQIKNKLLSETNEKCAYCESKMRHITYGDIEHVIPKSEKPELSFEWINLTLACDVCNTNKGTFYEVMGGNDDSVLIDPYLDTPTDHFMFLAEHVRPRPDSTRGYISDRVIKLSRNQLNERRRERLEFITGLVKAICLATNADEKRFLIEDLYNNHLGPHSEFSVTSNSYVAQMRRENIF